MSAIIEPDSASWRQENPQWGRVTFVVNAVDHNLIVTREYPGDRTSNESIELHLKDLPEIEGLLLNARLWLERATKQRGEIEAAETFAKTAAGDDPWSLCVCGHGPLDHDRPADVPVGACNVSECRCSLWALAEATPVTMMVLKP